MTMSRNKQKSATLDANGSKYFGSSVRSGVSCVYKCREDIIITESDVNKIEGMVTVKRVSFSLFLY